MGNTHLRRSVEGSGMGRGTWGNKMDTTGTFRKENWKFEGGGFGVDKQG